MRLPRGLAVLAALAVTICFTAAPADARSCRGGSCGKVAHTKKLTPPAGYKSMKTTHHHRSHHRRPHRVVWHGWAGDSFYLDGVRYRGGSRRGPATAYNNWEGGFHPVAFWELHLRNVSGI
jgi:hypothetical protein